MKSKKEVLGGVFNILFGAALFGLIPILVRYGQGISTPSLVFFRVLFGLLFIYLIMLISKNKLDAFKKDKTMVLCFSAASLLAIGSYFISLKLIDIAPAVLLLYSQSIFIILFSKFWLKERINRYTIISLIFSILGIVLIVSPSSFKFSGSAIGYIFAISAAFWAALSFVIPKKYLKSYSPYSLTFYQSLWQIPVLLPFVLIYPPKFTLLNFSIFIGLGLFCTALAFLFIYKGIKKVPGQYIGILQTSEAIVPIILGALLFSEFPSPTVFLGGFLLIAGYVLIGIKESKR